MQHNKPANRFNASRDVLVFDHLAIAFVPEPETYVMMIVGLGFIGTMTRRRKVSA